MRIGKKYKGMLEDPDIKRWFDNVARGSQSTADVRLRGLGRFCTKFNLNPKALLEKSEKEVSDLMMDYVSELERNGNAGSYIESCLRPVKSWLKYNGFTLTRPIKIKNSKIPTTLSGQRTPSQEQLKKIMQSATKASRVCIALVAQSGLRLEVLGDYQGRNGLKLGDFPEIRIGPESVEFDTVPARIVIRTNLSKAGHEYFSFIGPEGVEYIKNYLNDRIRGNERLTLDSPLIVPKNKHIHFISTINIGDQIRNAIRKAGFPWRPYDLRHYFASRMLEAESRGAIVRDWRVFFMGHKGDIEHQYTLNNRALSSEDIDKMRSAYSKCVKFLETEQGMSEKQHNEEINGVKIMMLKLAGYSEEEINNQHMLDMDISGVVKKFDDKRAKALNNNNSQKVVSFKDVEKYIEQGWEYVRDFPGNKAIVKLPS